ncbi:hypothetical protein Aperf_G00000072767 [Anoplocephala perfoliata]
MVYRVVTVLTIIAIAISACVSNPDKCKEQQKIFTEALKRGHPIDFNDTKETIQLTWAGEAIGVIILVTMSESEQGLGQPSDIYRSVDNGKTFEKITANLGENIHIKRENGLQTRKLYHKMRKIYVICHDMHNRNNSLIYSTIDSGNHWKKSLLPFVLNGKLKFSPRDPDSNLVLTLEVHTKTLFVSEDGGVKWRPALQDVQEFFWSSFAVDNKFTLYALHGKVIEKPSSGRDAFTLSKSEDGGRTWRVLLENVRKIWAPEVLRSDADLEEDAGESQYEPSGRFLYATHFTSNEKSLLQLSVSDDGGRNFHRVFLPSIVSDRFFSVLEIEKDCVFLHIDEPGDTGHGILYVSDSTGTVFTESLRRHFYPSQATVTDFFRILSIPGTFLATQMNPDTTLRTVITHDRGATWQPLPVPEGLSCDISSRSKMIEEQADIGPADFASSGERLKATSTANISEEAFEASTELKLTVPHSQSVESSYPHSQLWIESAWRGNLSGPFAASISICSANIADVESPGPDSLLARSQFTFLCLLSCRQVCGLQVSNQFSLRKRVVASPPLATSTARGLILVHGHVATHLKTTPADVFISADGGYTWYKGLDGPHHYQIANRGGLLVAVPADTLWVEYLRFSTDGGRCWHNIHLTPSYKPTSEDENVNETTQSPPLQQQSTMAPDAVSLQTPTSLLLPMEEETVVFTGLVTEPGGRAMTVAVYGYGTLSQRWRVAVVDFANNGFITKNCTADDYELWYPHRTDSRRDDPSNGCLLGVRETSYRLKKDALCFSNANFRSLQYYEICACTEQDYECEYGYWREKDSNGKCVENPHAPPLDICDLVGLEGSAHLLEMIGYRKIPGSLCKSGWEPPHSNLTFEERTKHCPPKRKPYGQFGLATKIALALLALILIAVIVGAVLYHRRRESNLLTASLRHRRFPKVFRRCLRHSHLISNKDFKANSLAPNTVFFASDGLGVVKTSPALLSNSPHQYLAPQITHFSGDKRAEDRLDLLENEEPCAEDEPFPTSSTNERAQNSEQGVGGSGNSSCPEDQHE